MKSENYNGWTNYETWAAKLWFDQDDYYATRAEEVLAEAEADALFTQAEKAALDLAWEIKGDIEDGAPTTEAGLYTDLLNGALSEINWHEVAQGYIETAKQEEGK